MNSTKRKVLFLVAILLALVVFTFAAFKFTTRPQFCASCHIIKPAVETWAVSTHKDVHCMDCHADPGTFGYIKRKIGGLKEVYMYTTKTYELPLEAKVNQQNCIRCHSNIPTAQETKKYKFPHQKHLEIGYNCLSCHTGVVHEQPKEPMKLMNTKCSKCHDVKSPDKCKVCHK